MRQNAGYYAVEVRNAARAAGSYLAVFKAGEYQQKKMVLLTD
jgi:hypothetical protein